MPELVEVEKLERWGKCRRCKHEAKLSKFRLTHNHDQVLADGSVKRKQIFDGVYRCPYCGETNPERIERTVIAWELAKPEED